MNPMMYPFGMWLGGFFIGLGLGAKITLYLVRRRK